MIRRAVGGPAVMKAQLEHLLAACEEGQTTLQVIPFSAGAHAGITGPFVILSFAESTDRDVVYVETLAGDIYLEEDKDVERYRIVFERLLAVAASPDDSLQLPRQVTDDLR